MNGLVRRGATACAPRRTSRRRRTSFRSSSSSQTLRVVDDRAVQRFTSTEMKLLGVASSVALNLIIWGFTVGLAAADASATTFYVVWVFFAAVMLGGTFLMIRWGREGRRWLWRISISWSILFLVSVATLLLALIPLGLLALMPRFRRWLSSWLVPPRPPTRSLLPRVAEAE